MVFVDFVVFGFLVCVIVFVIEQWVLNGDVDDVMFDGQLLWLWCCIGVCVWVVLGVEVVQDVYVVFLSSWMVVYKGMV